MGNRRVFAAPEKAAQQNPPPRREGNGKLDELSADRLCEAVVDAVHGLGAWQWLTASEREAAREALRRATVLVSPHAREPISGDVQYHVKVEP